MCIKMLYVTDMLSLMYIEKIDVDLAQHRFMWIVICTHHKRK
jgi:hypothetical protein